MPTWPRPTSATRRWKPGRPSIEAPDRPKSSSITTIDARSQPSCSARSTRAYCSRVEFLVSLNLLKRGLANVDYRHPLPMPTVDLVRHHAVGRRTPNLAHHDWTPRPQPPRGSGEVSSASVHAAPCVAGRRATSAIPVDRPRSSRDPSQRTSARSASRPSMGGPGKSVKLSAVSWMGYRMQLTRQQGPALRHGSGHHPCQIPRAA